jgi:hypothetical protein
MNETQVRFRRIAHLVDEVEKRTDSAALQQAAAAFQSDLQPVVTATVAALKAGDLETFKGLRALLPHLLAEVTATPALADVLARQMGQALVEGLTAKPEAAP